MKLYIRLFLVISLISACQESSKPNREYTVVKGNTMGTTYEIAYDSSINLKERIDFTLGYYSYLLSTYDSNSIISKFNSNRLLTTEDSVSFETSKAYFIELNRISETVNKASEGAFNPGLAELINYWGFGDKKKNPEEVNAELIDSLKNRSYGFQIAFVNRKPLKKNIKQTLNFNAIAPGQAVDILADLMDSVYHIKNYYINISGEIRAKGNNGTDSYWPIKIEKPVLAAKKPIEFCSIPLKNYGMATSGNYRQFFFKNGKRYGHSIDPRTGFPARNSMLSATVLAPTAAEADAYATACMVIGLEKAISLIQNNASLKAFFIYEDKGQVAYWSSENLGYTLAKN